MFSQIAALWLHFSQRRSHSKSARNSFHPSSGVLPQQVELLVDINLHLLRKAGVRGIILDLDNTIVSEHDRYLSPTAELWLQEAKLHQFQLFILSNGKRRHRVEFWSHHFNIPALSPARKPFPFAFRYALQSMKLKPRQVIVIGDSFHTDVLGAWVSGCRSIQVASLPHPPRVWEKWIGRFVHRPYPSDRELWHCHFDLDSKHC